MEAVYKYNSQDSEELLRDYMEASFEAVEHENRLGLLCTTVNQTINDLLRAD